MLYCSNLCEAKKGCLQREGVGNPSSAAIKKALTREELSRHCRRRTCGEVETRELMEQLLLSMAGITDSGGNLLFGNRIATIWEEEKRHVACIQDPEGVALYTITGRIVKGGIELPVFRCARGTTSLESFHLHLARYLISVLFCGPFLTSYCNSTSFVRFIPGSSASDVHYQAYLLEGLSRWNQA